MATVYKTLLNNDIKSTRTLLHEAIPLTGTIFSGTYGGASVALGSEPNIKNYAHGMFQSVYDYPYLSSSANHILDLTVGYANSSALSSSTNTQNAKKINIYNQMAGTLMGYDATGSVILFDQDGDISAGGRKIREAVFINFARLLQKDEVKKGSFSITLGGGNPYSAPFYSRLTITDAGAQDSYKVNSAVGEYGILSCSAGGAYSGSTDTQGLAGLIFYQAGVAVLSSSVFQGGIGTSTVTQTRDGVLDRDALLVQGDSQTTISGTLTGSTIEASTNALRHRIYDMSFNNTTELNSTIHFCRAGSSDFNYSANPTYVSSSKMRVKNTQTDAPISYITTVGLYSADNELLAVAKLSEPLKKDPTNELTLRVRLDY